MLEPKEKTRNFRRAKFSHQFENFRTVRNFRTGANFHTVRNFRTSAKFLHLLHPDFGLTITFSSELCFG